MKHDPGCGTGGNADSSSSQRFCRSSLAKTTQTRRLSRRYPGHVSVRAEADHPDYRHAGHRCRSGRLPPLNLYNDGLPRHLYRHHSNRRPAFRRLRAPDLPHPGPGVLHDLLNSGWRRPVHESTGGGTGLAGLAFGIAAVAGPGNQAPHDGRRCCEIVPVVGRHIWVHRTQGGP